MQPDISTEIIEYECDGAALEGVITCDRSTSSARPAVIVVHDYRGVSSYTERRSKQLVELGFVAFAADIYGKGIRPQTMVDAREIMGRFNSDVGSMRSRAQVALNIVRESPLVDRKRIAVIGYCFGGKVALELARSGAEIAAAVSFHGGLAPTIPGEMGPIPARVLALHGADDPHIGMNQVQEFAAEMSRRGARWELAMYGGAVHGFTKVEAGSDPSTGSAYNADADRRSWLAMTSMLEEVFA